MREEDLDKYLESNDKQADKKDDFGSVKHSVVRKKRERKLRKQKKKLNNIKKFLRFIISMILLVGCYFFFKIPQWYLPQDAFKNPILERVEIYNNKIIPNEVIWDSIKDVSVPKYPIFLMKTKRLQKALYSIPVVDKVYIRRFGFPARVQIIINERIPIVLFKANLKDKPIAFYTSDGVLVTNPKYMALADSKDTLKILTTQQALKKDIDLTYIHELQQIVKEVEQYSGEKVQYIDIRKPNDVYVKIKTTSLRLGVLDSSVYKRIEKIYTILPQIKDIEDQIRYIDLSWDKVNYLKLKKKK